MTSLSNSSQSTCPTGRMLGKNNSSFLDFIHNYERASGIFVPCNSCLSECPRNKCAYTTAMWDWIFIINIIFFLKSTLKNVVYPKFQHSSICLADYS